MYSLLRTIGSSVGISIVSTVMTREGQVAWNQLGGHLQPYNPAVYLYLDRLHLLPADPAGAAVLGLTLGRQAQMIALVDAFTLIAWSFVAMLPMVLLLRGTRSRPAAVAAE